MRIFRYVILGVIVLAGSSWLGAAANAAPFLNLAINDASAQEVFRQGLVHKAHGCHHYRLYGNIRRPRYPVWHKHLSDCAPIPAPPPIKRGIIYRDGLGYYCHPEWRKHRHPTFGKSWHRHAGSECYVTRGWKWKGGPRTGCHRVKGAWICG